MTGSGYFSLEKLPVERAELDGFEDLVAGDLLFPSEIGQGAGDFQNAVVGAGGEVHLLHGVLQVAGAFGIELAVSANLTSAHGGVGGEFVGFESADLDVTRGGDALPDRGGGFAGDGVRSDFAEINDGHFDVDVDTCFLTVGRELFQPAFGGVPKALSLAFLLNRATMDFNTVAARPRCQMSRRSQVAAWSINCSSFVPGGAS